MLPQGKLHPVQLWSTALSGLAVGSTPGVTSDSGHVTLSLQSTAHLRAGLSQTQSVPVFLGMRGTEGSPSRPTSAGSDDEQSRQGLEETPKEPGQAATSSQLPYFSSFSSSGPESHATQSTGPGIWAGI